MAPFRFSEGTVPREEGRRGLVVRAAACRGPLKSGLGTTLEPFASTCMDQRMGVNVRSANVDGLVVVATGRDRPCVMRNGQCASGRSGGPSGENREVIGFWTVLEQETSCDAPRDGAEELCPLRSRPRQLEHVEHLAA